MQKSLQDGQNDRPARHPRSARRASRSPKPAISLADMMVTATAIENGLLLMTDNRKDFLLPELTSCPLT
jgi:predicted nucleic acid-binding protein